MQTLLVAGIDTLLGSNVALALREAFDVVGLASGPLHLEGVRVSTCAMENANDLAGQLRAAGPDWILYGGPMSRSSWEPAGDVGPAAHQAAVNLAREARSIDCPLTVVSTDGVFSGPWLFHDEDESPRAPGWYAQAALAMESAVREYCPGALVVRTNAYGWSPRAPEQGWIEQICEALENGTELALEADCGATPILATDLAPLLAEAYRRELTGLYHVAGSERTSPYHFARALADVLSLSAEGLKAECHEPIEGTVRETSLRVLRVQTALGKVMPMLRDGLERLVRQREDGFADAIHAAVRSAAVCENVA